MPSRRRTATVFAACSYASLGLTAVKNFALVPLYLAALGVEGYGSWVALSALAGAFGMLEGGLSVPFAQRIGAAEGAGDRRRFVEVFAAGLVVVGATSLVLVLLAGAAGPWLVELVAPRVAGDEFSLAFWLAAAGTVLLLVQASAGSVLLAWQRPGVAGTSRILGVAVEIGAIVAGLQLGLGVVALGLGVFAGAVTALALTFATVVVEWKARALPRPSLGRGELSSLASEVLPALPLRAGSAVLANADTAVISMLLGAGAAAQYSLTERAVRMGEMVVNPIAGSSLSGLAHAAGEKGRAGALPAIRELATVSALVSAAILGPCLLLDGGFVGLWVGEEHFLGLPLTVALVIAATVTTRHGILGVTIQSLGGTLLFAGWSTLASALRIALAAALLATGAVDLLALPAATVAVQGILGPWVLGRVAVKRLELPAGAMRPVILAGAPTVALGLGAFSGLAAVLPLAGSWWTLVFEGLLAAGLSAGIVLGSSAYARRELARLAGRAVGGRLGRMPSNPVVGGPGTDDADP